MTRIHRLPDHLVNQIAAGEVVERPASVVKELVENSIDAGSTRITVDLKDGGRQLVRVTDDGLGMTAAEVELALMRHATSKIASEADLAAIGTLGFRGEALPAICAVSRFSLLSCPREAESGTLSRGEGGVVSERITVTAQGGTTVEIQDLFFNTPARLKFLKSAQSELAMTLRLLHAITLAHPEIHFRVSHNGRIVLTAPRASGLRDRVGALLGFELATGLIDIDRDAGTLAVRGLIGPPALARGNRDEITLIVNGRPVRDTLLTQTLLDAYRPLLPRDRFPVAVLAFTLPLQEVDVNVHPTKAWVRFRGPRVVQELLFTAVQEALHSSRVVPSHRGLVVATPEATQGPAADASGQDAWPALPGPPPIAPTEPSLFQESEAAFVPGRFGAVIGQLHDTFIVSASAEEVFFVDQHVAHERVLFERLQHELAEGALPSQELLFPQVVDLAPAQAALLGEWITVLDRLGFALETFGPAGVLLRAVPPLLDGEEPRRLLEEMVQEVGASRKAEGAPLLDRALAFVACRGAIKARASLEREEMARLLADLSAAQTPFFCPHGRPILSRLSLRDIKRELRRTW